MDLQLLMPWLGAIALIWSLGNTVFGVFTSGAKENTKDITAIKADAVELASRVQAIESEIKHLPDAKSVMELRLAMSDLSGKIGRMEEGQKAVATTITRVENFLLSKSAA